jgi:AMP phosphorylase
MKLKILFTDLPADIIVINSLSAKKLEILPSSLLKVNKQTKNKYIIGKVLISSQFIANENVIAVSSELNNIFAEGEEVEVISIQGTESKSIISKMLHSQNLSEEEIKILVKGITEETVSPIQTTAFMLSHHFRKVDISEVEMLTKAFADSGNRLEWKTPAYSKHSIGGIPGNKVSLLIIPIVAAAGLLIPKMATKAITSASGTVDTMEVLADVNFSPEELYAICNKTKGAIVSGEKLNVGPAIDKIIDQAGYPLGIDPPSLILAGIISKKLAMGVEFMVLDLPVGKANEAKFTLDGGRQFGRTFVDLAQAVGITSKIGLTYGSVPVGHTIGPALEAHEGLSALINPNHAPHSLVEKSTSLAGLIFEMAGIANRGQGQQVAMDILTSGKAYEKMKQIIEAQGGDPKVKPEDIELAPYTLDFQAPANGWPVEIKNKALTQVARAAGAPEHPGAGVRILTKKESVRKGETVFRVYAHSESAIEEVRALIAKTTPIVIEGLLIGTIS